MNALSQNNPDLVTLEQKRQELADLIDQMSNAQSYESVDLSGKVSSLMQNIREEEYLLYQNRSNR